jgi:hypothetical protein
LHPVAFTATRQIGFAVAPGTGHHTANLVNFFCRIVPAPAGVSFDFGKIAFLMPSSQVRHGDAGELGHFGRMKLPQPLLVLGLKAVTHVCIQRFR